MIAVYRLAAGPNFPPVRQRSVLISHNHIS